MCLGMNYPSSVVWGQSGDIVLCLCIPAFTHSSRAQQCLQFPRVFFLFDCTGTQVGDSVSARAPWKGRVECSGEQ